MWNVLKITLLLALTTANSTSIASPVVACDFLSTLKNAFSLKPKFQESQFLESKEKYRKALQEKTKIDPLELKNPNNRLALVDAANSLIPVNPLDLESFIKTATPRQKSALYRIAKSLKENKGFALSKLNVRVEDLYSLVNREPNAYLKSYLPLINPDAEKLIKERIELPMLKGNIESAFKEINLIRDPGVLENFRRFRQAHKNFENLITASAVDGAMVHFMGPMGLIGGKIPDAEFFSFRQELIAKASKEGYAAIREELMRMPGARNHLPQIEASYNYGKRMLVRGIVGYGAYYVATNWTDVKNKVKFGAKAMWMAMQLPFITQKSLQEDEDASYNLNERQLEQIKSSFQGSLAFGTPLTPDYIWKQSEGILKQGADVLYNAYTPEGKKKKDEMVKSAHPIPPSSRQINEAALKTLNEMSQPKKNEDDETPLDPKVVKEYQEWVTKNHPEIKT